MPAESRYLKTNVSTGSADYQEWMKMKNNADSLFQFALKRPVVDYFLKQNVKKRV